MKKIVPDYYERFQCIAGSCPFTCCQEWKIAVDDAADQIWKKKAAPKETLPKKRNLSAYTRKKDGIRVIALNQEHKCPFLSEDKLCRLVSLYGESILSKTCAVFPRETHKFLTHEEALLMPSCPAVLDIWKECEELNFPDASEVSENPLFLIRQKILTLFLEKERSLEALLKESFYILLELYKAEEQEMLSQERVETYFSEDARESLRTAMDQIPFPVLDTIDECNELLQDLSVNYQKENLYPEYLTPILLAAEQFADDYEEEEQKEAFLLFQKEWKKQESLLRNFLRNEIFAELLLPNGDLESMIIKMQWIAMEYTAIRQSLFLRWNQEGRTTLHYEMVRDVIVLLTRMMGYEQEDIYEYLENSFEELLWDWGYFALIVGE